ncbi:hypothetical protein, partial [Lentilactobacillus diolivorans]|uniref:hypothetical protein n=1 Tax=Lentilactobacillus diolivorans TaxID=179838 RepID=UPI001CDCBAF8
RLGNSSLHPQKWLNIQIDRKLFCHPPVQSQLQFKTSGPRQNLFICLGPLVFVVFDNNRSHVVDNLFEQHMVNDTC